MWLPRRVRIMPESEREQTVIFPAVEEFVQTHGLEGAYRRIRKIPAVRPSDAHPYGDPRKQRVQKAFVLDLLDQNGLLDEYYSFLAAFDKDRPIFSASQRREWRDHYNECRERYESQIECLSSAERAAYEKLKSEFAAANIPASTTACDLEEPPPRISTVVNRIIRDTPAANDLKRKYDFTCQVCMVPLAYGDGRFYVEVHHLRPLGRPHDGPDNHQNMLVLCPNCHALFDLAVPRFIDDQTIEINDNKSRLTFKQNHKLANENIAYYTQSIRQQ